MLHYIDTRQGTDNRYSYSNGNTLPYTGVPFGMNHYTVQTNDDRGSWFFHPGERTFQGFRLTHQPSPWMGDFASLLITPVADDKIKADSLSRQSSYRPEEAVFKPHHLRIRQLRYNIESELTPTCYGAFLNVNYRSRHQAGLVLSARGQSSWKLDAENRRLTAFVNNYSGCHDDGFGIHAVFDFDHAVDAAASGWYNAEGKLVAAGEQSGEAVHFIVRFLDCSEDTLQVQLSTSFISAEQALLNQSREADLTFAAAKGQAEQHWNRYLGKIKASHSDEEVLRTFYSCLYRMFLFPQKFYETDASGQPVHYDTTARCAKPGVLYTNNGFWDTFRTVYPFYSMIAPAEYEEMLEGFLNSFRETGFLPKWLSPDERGIMPGTLIDAVIADAAVKGIGKKLMPELLQAMVTTATTESAIGCYGRHGMGDYLKYGYVPNRHGESVNHTLDYAYSDFCISRVARTLDQAELAEQYAASSLNYRNLIHPDNKFMVSRDEQGEFRPDFLDTRWGVDYAEGSAWQSSFAVAHDIGGLIDGYGSMEAFAERLTELCNAEPRFDVGSYGFEIHEMSEMAAVDYGQLAISNQPSFHIPYLFNYAGQPASSQVVLRQIMRHLFHSGTDGFPGDEDNGSMSGWYVFSAMGFYPVCPGSGEYVLGIPLLDRVDVELANGNILRMRSENNVPQANFVTHTDWNGSELTRLFVTHDELMEGGTLSFRLGLAPPQRTYAEHELPFSLSRK